jgi:KipI family sensor histidine kinase inhibitor
LDHAVAHRPIEGVVEVIPTYRSLMLHFDPERLSFEALRAAIEDRLVAADLAEAGKEWLIPVCFDLPFAEDLAEAAAGLSLHPDAIVRAMLDATFRIAMFGFAPGFAYLSGCPAALAIPRRQTPRPPIAPGSIIIAAGQAIVASISMPTGWYVLGQTPERMYDLHRSPVFLCEAGDVIRFEAVDPQTYASLHARTDAGETIARITGPNA